MASFNGYKTLECRATGIGVVTDIRIRNHDQRVRLSDFSDFTLRQRFPNTQTATKENLFYVQSFCLPFIRHCIKG